MNSPRMMPDPLSRDNSMHSGLGAALGDAAAMSEDEAPQSMRVSLQLEAASLPNLDRKGKSDPFVLVYRKVGGVGGQEDWAKVGQTETVYNNLNPQWSTTFAVEYSFGANFVLKFNLYDRDSKDEDLSKHDYIGEVRCTIAQIVLADNQCLVLQVYNPGAKVGQAAGTLTIRGEELKGDLGDSATLQFAVTNLRRGRKPFYILSRKNRNDSRFSPVTYSEVHQAYSSGGNQLTHFKPTHKLLSKLVNGDMERELQIQFMDYDRRGSHYRGGTAVFTLRTARAAVASGAPARFKLKKRKTNGQMVDAGDLLLKKCEISVPYSFLDYIQAGVVINLVVAVDMSATNGNPSDSSSLHYNDRNAPNEYVTALREVGNVLAAYNTSKNFPAFGFGAALPPEFTTIAHCFALTGEITQPMCEGVDGLIETYYNALDNVAPYGPCFYGPVLNHVIEMTRRGESQDSRTVYTVLLLITDGDFSDFAATANLICAAAELPLSIVIVGVGNSHFVQLERLDGDEVPLCSTENHTPCARDIVQFVPFHKHRFNPAQLAREVLDEIPEQMVSYMRSKSIKPADIVHPASGSTPPGSGGMPGNPPYSPLSTPFIPRRHATQTLPHLQAPPSSGSMPVSGFPGMPHNGMPSLYQSSTPQSRLGYPGQGGLYQQDQQHSLHDSFSPRGSFSSPSYSQPGYPQ